MATIINFQEYVQKKGKSNQCEESESVSSESGRIIYFNELQFCHIHSLCKFSDLQSEK